MINNNKIKKWTIRLTFLAVAVSLFLYGKKLSDDWGNFPSHRPLNTDSLKFNSKEWTRQLDYYEEIRPYMIGDLMKNVLVHGMDTLQVKELLGERMGWGDERTYYYKLGAYREIEASYLVVEFDENGKLIKTQITDM